MSLGAVSPINSYLSSHAANNHGFVGLDDLDIILNNCNLNVPRGILRQTCPAPAVYLTASSDWMTWMWCLTIGTPVHAH
jgi:hypothetical protein